MTVTSGVIASVFSSRLGLAVSIGALTSVPDCLILYPLTRCPSFAPWNLAVLRVLLSFPWLSILKFGIDMFISTSFD